MIKYPSIEQFRSVVKRVRELHDFQGLEEGTQLEHRQIAEAINTIFQQQFPNISKALNAQR